MGMPLFVIPFTLAISTNDVKSRATKFQAVISPDPSVVTSKPAREAFAALQSSTPSEMFQETIALVSSASSRLSDSGLPKPKEAETKSDVV